MSNAPITLEQLLERIQALGAEAISASASELILRLKKSASDTPSDLISTAVETYIARRTAPDKLGAWATNGYFTLPLLEQASRAQIASHRAQRFTGLKHILEIGTGTASDTSALARVAKHITTIEIDPRRAELARHNLDTQGITNYTLLVGDPRQLLTTKLDLASFDGFFADPARRTTNGERVRSGDDYSPPLKDLIALEIGALRAIKISPGLFVEGLPPTWAREFIGFGDECLEQTLWYGSQVTDSSVHLADIEHSWSPPSHPPSEPTTPTELDHGYLVEAHAVINRSQHLATYLAQAGIAQLAPDVAYGWSAERPKPQPLLRAFKIVTQLEYSPDLLAKKLSDLGWTNRTEIKKRNFNADPEAIRSSLKLPPHTHNAPFGTIFLFKWRQRNRAVLALRQGEA